MFDGNFGDYANGGIGVAMYDHGVGVAGVVDGVGDFKEAGALHGEVLHPVGLNEVGRGYLFVVVRYKHMLVDGVETFNEEVEIRERIEVVSVARYDAVKFVIQVFGYDTVQSLQKLGLGVKLAVVEGTEACDGDGSQVLRGLLSCRKESIRLQRIVNGLLCAVMRRYMSHCARNHARDKERVDEVRFSFQTYSFQHEHRMGDRIVLVRSCPPRGASTKQFVISMGSLALTCLGAVLLGAAGAFEPFMRSLFVWIQERVLPLEVGGQIDRFQLRVKTVSTRQAATRTQLSDDGFLAENDDILVRRTLFDIKYASSHRFVDPSNIHVE